MASDAGHSKGNLFYQTILYILFMPCTFVFVRTYILCPRL